MTARVVAACSGRAGGSELTLFGRCCRISLECGATGPDGSAAADYFNAGGSAGCKWVKVRYWRRVSNKWSVRPPYYIENHRQFSIGDAITWHHPNGPSGRPAFREDAPSDSVRSGSLPTPSSGSAVSSRVRLCRRRCAAMARPQARPRHGIAAILLASCRDCRSQVWKNGWKVTNGNLPPAFADMHLAGGSATPIQRIKEAVSEIKHGPAQGSECSLPRGRDPARKLSPALEQVDSSSGAIGSAVNRAIDALVPIIAKANVDRPTRAGLAGAPVASRRGRRNSVHRVPRATTGECARPRAGNFLVRPVSTVGRARLATGERGIWIFQGDSCVPFCAVRGGSPRSTAGAAGAGTVQVVARSALGREGTGGHGKKGGGSPLRRGVARPQ